MTQRTLVPVLGAALTALAFGTSCESRLPTTGISIRPIYGWQDGCTSVKISGHGFGADVTATIGGNPVTEVTLPADDSLDYGFLFNAVTPAGAASGYADVVVKTNGTDAPLSVPFYYEACPTAVHLDAMSPSDSLVGGTSVALVGCNIKSAEYQVKVGDAAPVAMTAGCLTASATFAAPELPAGQYPVVFVDSSGTTVWPTAEECVDSGGDTGHDTAPPATYCDLCPCVTYGGEG